MKKTIGVLLVVFLCMLGIACSYDIIDNRDQAQYVLTYKTIVSQEQDGKNVVLYISNEYNHSGWSCAYIVINGEKGDIISVCNSNILYKDERTLHTSDVVELWLAKTIYPVIEWKEVYYKFYME